MFAYGFSGYWKDVGTISSLWEANMDLLGEVPNFDLSDRSWKIYSRPQNESPQYISPDSVIKNSIVTEGCLIYGTVENSILFSGVTVERGAVIKDSVIMHSCVIKEGATVDYSIIDSNTVVGKGAKVGEDISSASAITVIETSSDIAPGSVIRS